MRADERNRSARGFSVIEVLIATTIFFIIAMGILPLFTQSIASNVAGREGTEVNNLTKSRVEELIQLPFNDLALTVPAGGNVLETVEYWSASEKVWKPGAPPAGADAVWVRTTRVRQFGVGDMLDGFLDNALPGSFPAEQIHLKEVEVEVRGTRNSGPFGGAKRSNVRMIRAV